MSAISQVDLNEFCERLESLEADKKEIADEIKDSIESFAVANELTKQGVSKFYKEWKEVKKSKEQYVVVDFEADKLLCVAYPEFATEGA